MSANPIAVSRSVRLRPGERDTLPHLFRKHPPTIDEVVPALVGLIRDQLIEVQHLLDTGLADSITVGISIPELARQFNVTESGLVLSLRIRPLLRALTDHVAISSLNITSDRRIQITLTPRLVELPAGDMPFREHYPNCRSSESCPQIRPGRTLADNLEG